MRGAIGSLNAAVAGSVLLFEAVAQRDPDARSSPPNRTAGIPIASNPSDPSFPTPSAASSDVPEAPAPAVPDAAAAEPPPQAHMASAGEPDDDLLPGGPDATKAPKPRKPRTARTPRA